MSLLTLKDIGKIYVSGTNVAVGIRGVNLSFDKGEFVAVTGKSGSGKSTLLNVISGMDTYEEGEMFVENEPTSHYVQQDWEEYRREYISFIFQDYNIIESFTVLQNVELALMHIENLKERRARAMELLHRVGLEKHLNHKGSKLSGGQKQRTVIARALAKDSPIILADEPTGNLDSKTSEEIIRLLREVSKDKMVLIVTHNFEQVENYATRHIRVFDGAIESDRLLIPSVKEAENAENAAALENAENAGNGAKESVAKKIERESERDKPTKKGKRFWKNFRDGMSLGWVRFTATPKLSVFLCVLMVLSALAITFVTSLCSPSLKELYAKNYVFSHREGRVVVIRQDGAVITDEELDALVKTVGADSAMHYDFLLDMNGQYISYRDSYGYFNFGYGNFAGIDAGRAPENDGEVLMRLPVSDTAVLGTDNFEEFELNNVFNLVDYRVVGVDYYYDNTKTPEIVFTESGYKTASALAYLASNAVNRFRFIAAFTDNRKTPDEKEIEIELGQMRCSFDIGKQAYYLSSADFDDILSRYEKVDTEGYEFSYSFSFRAAFTDYRYSGNDYHGGYYQGGYEVVIPGYGTEDVVTSDLAKYKKLTESEVPGSLLRRMREEYLDLLISPDMIYDFMNEHYYSKSYTQASLFFSSDGEAEKKVEQLRNLGYKAVASTAIDEGYGTDAILKIVEAVVVAFGWLLAIVFIALFLSLCSKRAMLATKGDIGILRSMGVTTPVIKLSIHIQTLIALIPAYIVTALAAVVIFVVPSTNAIFGFLHAWEYLLIALALLAVNLLLSRRYVKKMFGSSVKKTLKGDNEI